MRWRKSDVSFRLVDAESSGVVVTIEVVVPGGSLLVMGEPRDEDRALVVSGVHMSSKGLAPNEVGVANLRVIAQMILEALDYDELIVEGAVRTTGAGPGHRPRPLRFARSRRTEAGC
jgi:hypothetical protein